MPGLPKSEFEKRGTIAKDARTKAVLDNLSGKIISKANKHINDALNEASA